MPPSAPEFPATPPLIKGGAGGISPGPAVSGRAVSYYAASANPAPRRPSLEGAIHCDVGVIGGGITGCSAALHLAERGYRVVLLEAEGIGHGASGRSGGQFMYGFARDMCEVRWHASREEARTLWQLSLEAVRLIGERIERHAIGCDLAFGQMQAAIKTRHYRELVALKEDLEREYGYEGMEFLEADDVQLVLDSPRYIAGLYDARGGHLHPLNYTLGLAAAAEGAGACLFERTPAQRIGHGDTVSVRTPRGEVHCKHLILCGGAYMDELVPALRRKIMPVGTYILATEPLGEERARSLIRNHMAVTDMNFVLDYFRLSADHRLLFGGRVSYSGLAGVNLAAALRRRMLLVFPQLADAKTAYLWGGHVDITLNRLPHFGRLRDNVYFAHGFSGHGIAFTGLAGKLIAEAVAGTAERFDVFARIRHRDFFGGRLLRMPTLVLAMLYFRLRDLL